MRRFMLLLVPALLLAAFLAGLPDVARGARHLVLVDFEEGSAPLESYEGEDYDPYSWEIQSSITYGGSDYALRMWGNTWKQLAIDPYPVTTETVFQAAIYADETGELQAFGVGDSTDNVLFYCVKGTQLVLSDRWNVVYQGLYPRDEWHTYLLPVGQDWYDTWGYVPEITRLIFVNDHDDTDDGITIFDEVYDVTEDLPIAPTVEIQQIIQRVDALGPDPADHGGAMLYRVEMQFLALVYDPDSETHSFRWDFGDGTFSDEQDPFHTFTAQEDYTFTVALDVADDTGLFGRDTCQVAVDPSGEEHVLSINFTGDVFMGRDYDSEGGLIDTYGVEYLFDPTLDILGNAAHATMVNAECPYTDRGDPHPTKSVVFRTRPQNVAGLVYAGVDITSTGNNHIIDYGLEGLTQTHEVLDSAGIVHAGSGVNSYFALQPCYYTVNGVRLGFINFCNRTGRQYNEQPFFDAGLSKYGLGWWLEPHNERAIVQADSLADIVIAFPHSGEEYYTTPPREGSDDPWAEPIDVEQCPPYVPFDEARSFKFRIWPGLSDRELRYHAIDCGADAVLNSHPHVLQGFEVYNGCLIAHSLGNFMFDLYYPETMPTMVLRARFDKQGILGWTFKPAFIDDWIPRPATGRLGREIIDRMADYSRQLGALVGLEKETMLGRIFLDPGQAELYNSESSGSAEVLPAGDFEISRPIELAGEGSLSQIIDIEGVSPADCEVRIGREVLWFGNFEYDEGHSMWTLNSEDEWLDESVPFEGRYSLALHRDGSDHENVVSVLSRHLPAADSLDYGITGWMRTENAENAKFSLYFYEGRYGWHELDSFDMDTPVDGTSDWHHYGRDCAAPERSNFFNVRCNLDPPHDGDAMAWFDDLRVIEWLPWEPLALPHDVPYPNNYRFVQIRTPFAADSVTVAYVETALTDGSYSPVPEARSGQPVRVLLAGASPNPCRGQTLIRYRLGARARVSLEIFDLNGRTVSRLLQGEIQRPGWHRVEWIAPALPAGVYFSRLSVDDETYSRKMVLLR